MYHFIVKKTNIQLKEQYHEMIFFFYNTDKVYPFPRKGSHEIFNLKNTPTIK